MAKSYLIMNYLHKCGKLIDNCIGCAKYLAVDISVLIAKRVFGQTVYTEGGTRSDIEVLFIAFLKFLM